MLSHAVMELLLLLLLLLVTPLLTAILLVRLLSARLLLHIFAGLVLFYVTTGLLLPVPLLMMVPLLLATLPLDAHHWIVVVLDPIVVVFAVQFLEGLPWLLLIL